MLPIGAYMHTHNVIHLSLINPTVMALLIKFGIPLPKDYYIPLYRCNPYEVFHRGLSARVSLSRSHVSFSPLSSIQVYMHTPQLEPPRLNFFFLISAGAYHYLQGVYPLPWMLWYWAIIIYGLLCFPTLLWVVTSQWSLLYNAMQVWDEHMFYNCSLS